MYLTQVQIQCKYNAFKYTEYNLNTLKYNVFDPSPNTMNTYLPCRTATLNCTSSQKISRRKCQGVQLGVYQTFVSFHRNFRFVLSRAEIANFAKLLRKSLFYISIISTPDQSTATFSENQELWTVLNCALSSPPPTQSNLPASSSLHAC